MAIATVAWPAGGAGRIRRVLKPVVMVALLATVWLSLGPVEAGGPDSFVVTSGISMLPRFHANGLVITRREQHYHVGEVAAYHNEQLHTVVMHRIVAIRGNHYYFKGDNNNFIDSYHPTESQIVGKEWLYAPNVGRVMKLTRTPMVFGVLIGILGMIAATAYVPRRNRRRRRHHAY